MFISSYIGYSYRFIEQGSTGKRALRTTAHRFLLLVVLKIGKLTLIGGRLRIVFACLV